MGQHKRRLGYNGETDSSARPGREKVDRGRAAGADVRSVLPLSELDVSLSVAFMSSPRRGKLAVVSTTGPAVPIYLL